MRYTEPNPPETTEEQLRKQVQDLQRQLREQKRQEHSSLHHYPRSAGIPRD